jgi:hypothetical protein
VSSRNPVRGSWKVRDVARIGSFGSDRTGPGGAAEYSTVESSEFAAPARAGRASQAQVDVGYLPPPPTGHFTSLRVSSSALPLLELSCKSPIGYSPTKRRKPVCNRLVRDRLSLTTLFSRWSLCDASPVSPPAIFRAARRRWDRRHCGSARVYAIIIAKPVDVQQTVRALTWTNR